MSIATKQDGRDLADNLIYTVKHEEGERVDELFEEFEYEFFDDDNALAAARELKQGMIKAGLI